MTSDEVKTIVDVLTGLREDMRALIGHQRFQTIATDQNTVALRSLGQKLNVIGLDARRTRENVSEVKSAIIYPKFSRRPRKKTVAKR